MQIAVCIKSVIDTGALLAAVAEEPVRTAQNSIMNPADLYALETAISLKRTCGGTVDIYTMGKSYAEQLLRECARFGADHLYLLSDPAFAGSDTYATATILRNALQHRDYDLILCGERAIDGETGQVPGELSALLDMPYVTGVTALEADHDGKTLCCTCLFENGTGNVRVPLPAVLGISCGMQGIGHPLAPRLTDLRRARDVPLDILDSTALQMERGTTGLHGSPTRVQKTTIPQWGRSCQKTEDLDAGLQATLEVIYGL